MARCEAADECRWHLGELRVRCTPSSCRRAECSAALQRFARFVPFALVESMMFCHCSAGDSLCTQQQEVVYPKCLYSTSSTAITCTEAVRKCDEDLRCRASVLEQPCYCPLSDVECMGHQRVMIPNNPCIEKAMLDYSRLMGYTITAVKTASIETNRVLENTKQSDVKEGFQPSRTRIVVDSRGIIKSGADGYSSARRTDYGLGGQIRIPSNVDVPRERFRVEKWKSSATENEVRAPERRNGDSIETTSATSTLMATYMRTPKGSSEGKRKEKPRTTLSPVSTEPPPPWVTTTEKLPTTTVPFVTHAPPPKEGCNAKDASGREIFTHIGTVMRCLHLDFGERLFLRDRGACFCESSTFICDFPEEMPELYPGKAVHYLSNIFQTVTDYFRERGFAM
ncbi:unnamed protein product [Angiostrongylus costaricensis]|uniref:GDNF domain-containing protein n=1 Tax=Angiostrongylus costaricensis TaxID=334426 RepID=A0A158PFZ5_ANGCS|nr:unnamed protein product [Angiostrongylus costaricensis]